MRLLALLFLNTLAAAVPLFNCGVGVFDVTRKEPHPQFQAEYRFGYRWGGFGMPFLGAMITSRGSHYLYGGLGADLILGGHLAILPAFAAGYYSQGGGKNLGYPLEFRTSIEAAYIFSNEVRLGAQFSHISNASIGKKNPGEESLVLSLSIPLTQTS